MNKQKRALLYALSMFDGYVYKPKPPKSKGSSARLLCGHGPQQKAYLEWKADLIHSLMGGKRPTIYKSWRQTGSLKHPVYSYSKAFPYMNQIHRNLYFDNNKRRFTRKTLDFLDEKGLAIWLMDDGNIRKNVNKSGFVSSISVQIATCCSFSEIEIIKVYFSERWGIAIRPYQNKKQPEEKQWSFRMNTTESRKFGRLVIKHIPECMMYKIVPFSDLTTQERQAPIGICSVCTADIFKKNAEMKCDTCYRRFFRWGKI